MVGVIRRRDILAHPKVTIDCFGWPAFLKVLIAGRGRTFLSVLAEAGAFHPPTVPVPELLGHCIDLELRAKRVYEMLAQRFADRAAVRAFFATLADQEQQHAELLELCHEAAGRDGWLEEQFAPWRDAVPRLEREMAEVEVSARSLHSVADALRLVILVEGSEINQVFDSVVAATDSDFVRKLGAFHTAETSHMSYICEQIPRLDPDLADESRELRAAFFGDFT